MSAREEFVACARAATGGRYCTPPRGPHCTDCSGLVARCHREATGQAITGDSHAQFDLGRVVSGALQPGDLLFFDTGYSHRLGNRASHVGIFVGNGRMVHAMNADYGVVESSLDSDYWRTRRLGARRLFTEGAPATGEPTGQPDEGSLGGGPSGGEPGPSPGLSTKPARERDRERRPPPKKARDRQRRRRRA